MTHEVGPTLSTDEDFRTLVRRVRQGEEAAAAELVKHYEPEIRLEVRVRLRLRNPRLRRVFDSMDVCQLVLASFFVRAAAGQYDLERPEQLVHLLREMARHKVADQAKFHQRQRRDVRRELPQRPDILDPPAVGTTPSGQVAGRELLDEIRKRFSDEERQMMDRRSQGQDWAGISREIGGSPDARRKQFTRALERVMRELGLEAVP